MVKRGKTKFHSKSGQVAIFIILALVIVGALVIYLVFRANQNPTSVKVDPKVEPIYNFVTECVKQIGKEGVFDVSMRGGYYHDSKLATDFGTPIYFNKKTNLMPTKDEVQKQLGEYLDERLQYCLNNFDDYPDFKVTSGKVITKAQILDSKVVYSLNFPLTIIKDSRTYNINKFDSINVPARLNVLYDTAAKYMVEQVKAPKDICFSCLNNYAVDNDLYVEIQEYNSDTMLIIITDKNTTLNDQELKFWFAVNLEN